MSPLLRARRESIYIDALPVCDCCRGRKTFFGNLFLRASLPLPLLFSRDGDFRSLGAGSTEIYLRSMFDALCWVYIIASAGFVTLEVYGLHEVSQLLLKEMCNIVIRWEAWEFQQEVV